MKWLAVCMGLPLINTGGQSTVPECASCHPAEAKLHASTRMAHAMMPVAESDFARNLPEQPLRESNDGYSLQYRRMGNGVAVITTRGADRAEGLIKWVLGAGAQGQTPLVISRDAVFESRVSYFPSLHRYGITIGQDAGASPDAESALGRKQSSSDLKSCIGCHSTAITRDSKPVIPGVQCERCHSGADDHARGRGTPFNPGKLAAADQARFCGACHRFQPPMDDTQFENIRFQPLRLMKSRCFTSGKLACITCHPAHQDARRNDPDFYNQKCHVCHDSRPMHVDERRQGDCIGCHMPYEELHPALKFTDHFIRVVKTGELPAALLRRRGSGS